MADIVWKKVQVILTDVPIEYMDCNSDAFAGGDEVIVEFTDQDWDQPKIIGFKEKPLSCTGSYVFPGQNRWASAPSGLWVEEASRSLSIIYNSETWRWKDPFPRNYVDEVSGSFGRERYAATGEGGMGFVVGGRNVLDISDDYEYYNHLDIYDSISENFTIGMDYPREMSDLSFDSLKNGTCVAHGGWNGYGSTVYGYTYRYKIASDLWQYRASGATVYNHASFTIDGLVYIVGGNSGTSTGTFADRRGQYIQNQNVEAYNDLVQSWVAKATCPQLNFVEVRGWNLEGKGLVGGGAYTYLYDYYQLPPRYPGDGYWEWVCETTYDPYVKTCEWVWVLYEGLWGDFGLQRNRETYLYDSLTDSWTRKRDNLSGSGIGNQATSTANGETVALAFSMQNPGSTNHWYDYTIYADAWSDRGEFGLYVYEEPGFTKSFDRMNSAGAEL